LDQPVQTGEEMRRDRARHRTGMTRRERKPERARLTLPHEGGGKSMLGGSLNGLRPANERKAPVLPKPEVHERHQPDDRDDDVPRDSAVDVERPVQQRHAEVSDEHAPRQPQVALASRMEDHATEDRGPETVTERGQHTSNELGEDDGRERQGEVLALNDEERGQRVAATLERREAEADRGAEHHPVTRCIRTQTQREHNDRRAFDELLDQPNLEVAAKTRAVHQPEFEERRCQNPEDPGDEERGHDAPRRERRTRIVVEVPDDRRDGHQETAEQEDGGENDEVACHEHGTNGGGPEGQPDEEDGPPAGRPALSFQLPYGSLVGCENLHHVTSRFWSRFV